MTTAGDRATVAPVIASGREAIDPMTLGVVIAPAIRTLDGIVAIEATIAGLTVELARAIALGSAAIADTTAAATFELANGVAWARPAIAAIAAGEREEPIETFAAANDATDAIDAGLTLAPAEIVADGRVDRVLMVTGDVMVAEPSAAWGSEATAGTAVAITSRCPRAVLDGRDAIVWIVVGLLDAPACATALGRDAIDANTAGALVVPA